MDPKELAERYFDTWLARDFDAFETLLAPGATFVGPMGQADGAAQCRAGIEGMSRFTTGIDVTVMVADGPDVITWYDLQTAGRDPIPTANWMHVEDGHIAAIRAVFDPRPILG